MSNPDRPDFDAVLNIAVNHESRGDPDNPRTCDWRTGNTCDVPALVDVWIGDMDEEGSGADYCPTHAEIVINAAVTRLVRRFRR